MATLGKEQPRFCKDCVYFAPPNLCGHEKALHVTEKYLVTGDEADLGRYNCEPMRAGICGQSGHLFRAIDDKK